MKFGTSDRGYFSQAYLMMVGIIQASVFAYLAKDSLDYSVRTYGGLSEAFGFSSGGGYSDPVVIFYLVTFGIVIIVTYEYLVALAHLHRAISEVAPKPETVWRHG